MDREVFAGKYALLRTKGENGLFSTHFVEDSLSGGRKVLKVCGLELGEILEYLKRMNLARDAGLPGLLLPEEGGILDDGSYYLAFPEVGEPSLEGYLRLRLPFSAAEAIRVVAGVLRILEGMHAGGFLHLFVNPRNLFYRPGGRLLLKDPALDPAFFAVFLEHLAFPDFHYFSPAVMDGGDPGPGDDVYSVGRLAAMLSGPAEGEGRASEALRRVASACLEAGRGGRGRGGNPAAETRRLAEDLLESISWKNVVGAGGRETSRSGPAFPSKVLPSPGKEAAGSGHGAESGAAGSAAAESGSLPSPSDGGVPEDGKAARGRKRFSAPGAGRGDPFSSLVLSLLVTCTILLSSYVLFFPAAGRDSPLAAEVDAATGAASAECRMDGGESGPEGSGRETAPCEGGEAADTRAESAAGKEPEGEPRALEADPRSASPPPGESVNRPPVARFTLAPGEGRSPLQVYLDASSSYDPDGKIVSYRWSFGGSGVSLYHVFESNVIPARVTVTLTVTDDKGASSSAARCVTLY